MASLGAWILVSLMGLIGLGLLVLGFLGIWTWVKELWAAKDEDGEPGA